MKPTCVMAIPLVLAACGTAKAPDSSPVAADSAQRQPAPSAPQAAVAPPPLITATTPDSASVARADSAVQADSVVRADSTKCAAAADRAKCVAAEAAKRQEPLRDSAYGPKFKVDSKGKVTPIKKP